MSDKKSGFIARTMKTLSDIEANELKATFVSFAFVFILMCAYYILRPVRDAMASDWTDAEVAFLWTLNFFISAGVVALYGIAVSKLKFKHLVPCVYGFFGLSFVFFYIAIVISNDRVLMDKSFYVWLSVFSLFHISVFWSLMADTFSKEQAKRLFAVIAAGSSAGALFGPAVPALFTGMVGTDTLMLVAAIMMLVPIPLIFYLGRLKVTELHNENVHADLSAAKIGGNPFAGFKLFFMNPYLLGIGLFIFIYTMIGSFVYFEQKNLLAEFSREERTTMLAYVDWFVNLLTFGMAFFLTGRIVKKFGMSVTLALMPVLIVFGMIILAFAPIYIVVLALQVVRRGGNYGVTRPAREMLFTEVDRETRFKAKPVIDIVVYRGGDMISGWFFTGLTAGLGLGMGAVAAVGAVIAGIWAVVGVMLGRSYNRETGEHETDVVEAKA
jgi:AAA family ATP:ADP antiporter